MTRAVIDLALTLGPALLLVFGLAWTLSRSRRARRRLAPLAGMMLLLGAFFRVDPPPPPRTEASPREDGAEDRTGAPPI
jgi:hypothetical protein